MSLADADHPDPTTAAATPDAGPPTVRLVHVQPWPDPVIDRIGIDPRSDYVEQYWLGVIGPASTLLVRHLSARLETEPDGFGLDLVHTAQLLGLGTGLGRWGPMQRTLSRCAAFGLLRRWGADRVLVRRRVPPVTRPLLARLPEDRRAAHEAWQQATLAAARRDAAGAGAGAGAGEVGPPRPARGAPGDPQTATAGFSKRSTSSTSRRTP